MKMKTLVIMAAGVTCMNVASIYLNELSSWEIYFFGMINGATWMTLLASYWERKVNKR